MRASHAVPYGRMPFFHDSFSRERRQHYDTWIQTTWDALTQQAVGKELGTFGVQLRDMVNNTYVPNVHWHRVSVPREHRLGDRIGVLPRFAADGILWLGKSALQPPRRRTSIIEGDLNVARGLRSPRDTREFLQEAIGRMPLAACMELVNPSSGSTSGAVSYYDKNTNILVPTRSLITYKTEEIPEHAALQGALGADALTRVHAIENLFGNPDFYFAAITELRARRVDAVVLSAGVAAMDISPEQASSAGELTMQIENLRRQHGINNAAVLDTRFSLNRQDHGNLILDMMNLNVL